ncbi:hypothetical protein [Brevibacterium luteolum]|uniref:hypothetical protein n=2 Tax=Brevibacterium luteolum TaxID=199591 RepID=UPI00223B6B88|nr:hypothetical protein [Brevibacterium luteolum]MCT1658166.1 hypothetical protein [Brevibacterium luteolum]
MSAEAGNTKPSVEVMTAAAHVATAGISILIVSAFARKTGKIGFTSDYRHWHDDESAQHDRIVTYFAACRFEKSPARGITAMSFGVFMRLERPEKFL